MILFVPLPCLSGLIHILICNTKRGEKSDITKSRALDFAACHKQALLVAQELINKVKSKCCGIKGLYKLCIPAPPSLNINKNDFDKPKDQRELAHFGLERNALLRTILLSQMSRG